MSRLSSYCLITVLLVSIAGRAQTNRTLVQLDAANGATNLAKLVKLSDLVVVGEFRVGTNDRMAKMPIKIVETIRESALPATNVAPCFYPTAMTISPKKGFRWIFFLQKPWEIKDGIEFRKVVGTYGNEKSIWNDDFEGIMAATEENVKAVRALVSANSGETNKLRVLIVDHLLRGRYLSQDSDFIFFESLADEERQLLAARFGNMKFQPMTSAEPIDHFELRDKVTKVKGMELRFESIKFTNNWARAAVWLGPGVLFDVTLVNDGE